jgi:hypothetical protein
MPSFITKQDIPRLMLAHTEANENELETFVFQLDNGQLVELYTPFAGYVIEAFEMAYRP